MPIPSSWMAFARRNVTVLTFWVLLTIIIISGVWAFKAYAIVKSRTETEVLASHQSQAEFAARFISDHQQRLLDRMTSLAARQDLLAAAATHKTPVLRSLLAGLAERPELSWLFVCDPEGMVIFHLPASPTQLGVNLSSREFFKKASQEGQPHISPLAAEPGPAGAKTITFITPLRDPERGVVGYFGVQQKRSYWTDSFARMASGPGQRVFVFDQAGNLVAGGSGGANEELANMNRLGRWLVSSGRPGIRVAGRLMEDPNEREPVFISAALAMPMNWLIIIAHDYDTAMAPVLLVFRNALVFLVLLLVCLLLVTFLLHSRYQMQEQALARADQETQRLDAEVRLRTQDLRQSNERIRQLSSHLIAAQEEERRKIALDLHDEVGSLLGALSIGLRQLAREQDEDPPKGRQSLARLVGVSDKLIGQIRSISYALRPTILDQLGLKAALADLCESMQETHHLPIQYHLAPLDESSLSTQLKMTLYRFLQEALTNAIKHSGSDRIEVSLSRQGDWLHLAVTDHGHGFDVEQAQRLALSSKKMGLLGMSERLEVAGGRLIVASGAQGTTITALLPWGDSHGA